MKYHHFLFALTISTAALLPAARAQITVATPAFAFGSTGTGEAQFQAVRGIAFATDGVLFVNDALNYRIQKLTATGGFLGLWGTQGTGNGQMDAPLDLCVDTNNNVFVLDTYNHRVQKFDTNGTFIMKWGTVGTAAGQFNTPRCLASDRAGNIYVSDTWNNRVQIFTGTGTFIRSFGGAGTANGKMIAPVGIVVDELGDVYVADQGNYRIQKFTSAGVYIMKWGSLGSGVGQFQSSVGADGGPNDMVIDRAGNVVVVDGGNNRIQVFSSAGKFITQFGSLGTVLGQMDRPGRVTFNNEGSMLYVTDIGNVRIQAFEYTLPPPSMLGMTLNGEQATMAWSAAPGQLFQIESKLNIEDAWGDYGPGMAAVSYPATINISARDTAQGFFRVKVVPFLGPPPGSGL